MRNTDDLYYATWKVLGKQDKNAIKCLEHMNGKSFSEFNEKELVAMYGVQEYILLEALMKVRQRREYYKSKVEESE